MSFRPKIYGIPSARPRPTSLVEFLLGPLTDAERKRLRLTGRLIYGKPPYAVTDEEKKEREEARAKLGEKH